MSKGDTFCNDLLALIFQAEAIANIADDAGSSPLTELWIALHTGDPGSDGNQETNEASYDDYARVSVARTNSGWALSGEAITPDSNIDFPEATGGSETITHFSIGTDETGTGKILYHGIVTPNISVSEGVTPRLTTDTTITED